MQLNFLDSMIDILIEQCTICDKFCSVIFNLWGLKLSLS